MTTYVLCYAADGRERVVSLRGTFGTESAACRAALRTLPRDEGWRAVRVMHGFRGTPLYAGVAA